MCAGCAFDTEFVIKEMSFGIHYNTGDHDLLSYMTNPEIFAVNDGMVDALTARVPALAQSGLAWK